jgi:predicted aspartyl protease
VTARFRYDESLDPAGPVLTVRVASPGDGGPGVLLPALVDTGADCTLVPPGMARALRLPAVGEIWIEGVVGNARRATVHAAALEFAGLRYLARVAAFGSEGVLGRDLLNRVLLRLDGPRRILSVGRPSKTA